VFDTKGRGECSVSVASVSANAPDGEVLSFEGIQSRVIVR
jgi:hypothetical protein